MGTRAGKEIKHPHNPNDSHHSLGCARHRRTASLTLACFLARWEAGTASTILEEAPEVWRS